MTDMPDYKQMLVMRKDLNMRKGKLCAQAAHASLGLYLKHQSDKRVKAWLTGRFKKITVYVNSEEELLDLVSDAKKAGVLSLVITDAGLTEFDGVPTITCAALGPDTDEALHPITGGLPLL